MFASLPVATEPPRESITPLLARAVEVHQRALIEDGLQDLQVIGVFYPRAKNIDTGIELFSPWNACSCSAFEESLALQPVHLGSGVSPDHIRLFVLELPGNDYDHIALSNPDSLLHLAGYAGHAGYAIQASDFNPVGSQQALYVTKYLSILFAGEADPGYYGPFFLIPRLLYSVSPQIVMDIRSMESSGTLTCISLLQGAQSSFRALRDLNPS